MIGFIYWMIITLIYIIGVAVINNRHRRIERFQQLTIEVLKNAIMAMGGEVTEKEGRVTILYKERGEDE